MSVAMKEPSSSSSSSSSCGALQLRSSCHNKLSSSSLCLNLRRRRRRRRRRRIICMCIVILFFGIFQLWVLSTLSRQKHFRPIQGHDEHLEQELHQRGGKQEGSQHSLPPPPSTSSRWQSSQTTTETTTKYSSKSDLANEEERRLPLLDGTKSYNKNRSSSGSSTNDPRLHQLQSCVPTHRACENYSGILHIKHTDMWSGFATVFFQLIISQLLYAEEYNLLPIVHLDNTSTTIYDDRVHRNMYGNASEEEPLMKISLETLPGDSYSISTIRHARYPQAYFPDEPIFKKMNNDDDAVDDARAQKSNTTVRHYYYLYGTGVWNDYFLPVNTDYCPTDRSCKTKPIYTMSIEQVSPGLMFYAPWSIKCWRYNNGIFPDILSRPHVPYEQWLLPQRNKASEIVAKYYHVQPDILETIPPIFKTNQLPASSSHNSSSTTSSSCLGLHIRWSDKKIGRRVVLLEEFLPYVEDYVHVMEEQQLSSSSHVSSSTTQAKRRCCIFLATDSSLVVKEMQETWPKRYTQYLIVSSAEHVMIRSNSTKHVADLGSHDVINRQILTDILCLSKCAYLIHGHSAVSEAVMYLNPTLIYQSVNLEDPHHRLLSFRTTTNTIQSTSQSTTTMFAQLVYNVTTGRITSDYWTTQYRPPMEWWEHLPSHYYVEYENNGNYYKRSILPTCPSGVNDDNGGGNTATTTEDTTLQNTKATTSPTNVDLVLTERTYDGHPVSILRWTTKVFVEFCQNLLLMKSSSNKSSSNNDGEKSSYLVVDPIWHYWFHRVSNETDDSASKDCSFSISSEHGGPKDGYRKNDHKWSILLNNATRSQMRSATVSLLSSANELIQIRQSMQEILQSQLTIREHIRRRSLFVFNATGNKSRCLGIHIGDPGHRRTRKGTNKKHTPTTWTRKSWGKNKYLEHIHRYFARQSSTAMQTNPTKCVYLASDAFEIWDEMRMNLTTGLPDVVVYTQTDIARNRNTIKAQWMEDSLERLGSETLVDVLNLASCGQLIHGSHPVAEAALYVNPSVTSIHIERGYQGFPSPEVS